MLNNCSITELHSQPSVKRFLRPLIVPEEKAHTSPTFQVTVGLACRCGSYGHRASIDTVSGIGH